MQCTGILRGLFSNVRALMSPNRSVSGSSVWSFCSRGLSPYKCSTSPVQPSAAQTKPFAVPYDLICESFSSPRPVHFWGFFRYRCDGFVVFRSRVGTSVSWCGEAGNRAGSAHQSPSQIAEGLINWAQIYIGIWRTWVFLSLNVL